MNKENIIDYVVQTPHNPNKKVLDDMLETLIEENGGGNASVGEQIAEAIAKIPQNDWNQNDETAKDYIKNRPFYDTSIIILDNYSYTEDIEVVNMCGKVSDSVIPNFKDIIESKKYSYDLYINGEYTNYELETEEYGELTPTAQAFLITLNNEGSKATAAIFNIIEDNAEMGLTKGVWILPAGGDYHFKNFKIEDEIKQIDPKYIPDSVKTHDWNTLKNKPFECELNLLEEVYGFQHRGNALLGVLSVTWRPEGCEFICVEINGKKFFDVTWNDESDHWGDADSSLWDNGEGYGFYISDRLIYIDVNRFSGDGKYVKVYEQLPKKTINPQYLPEADLNSYGVVKVVKADEYDDYEQYAPCVTFEGEVHAKTYKAANVFKELSFENLDTLIDYVGNHGLFTESVVEDITNEIELILPVHAWYIGNDYRDYSHKYLFETANGETLLLNIKRSTITKVEDLGNAGPTSSGIITLPSEEYPDITPDILMELPNGLYNFMGDIDVYYPVGENEEGNPIFAGSFIKGLFQKYGSGILCYGTGTYFGGFIFDEDNGLVAEQVQSLDGAGFLEVRQWFNEFANILGLNEHELSTTEQTIVGAINELNAKYTEGTDALILLSPNGTKFNITVSDDGVLSATKITE